MEMESLSLENNSVLESTKIHKLYDRWTLWAHLPHNTDWSLKSYIKIYEVDTAEQVLALNNSLPDLMINNCMLFLFYPIDHLNKEYIYIYIYGTLLMKTS